MSNGGPIIKSPPASTHRDVSGRKKFLSEKSKDEISWGKKEARTLEKRKRK